MFSERSQEPPALPKVSHQIYTIHRNDNFDTKTEFRGKNGKNHIPEIRKTSHVCAILKQLDQRFTCSSTGEHQPDIKSGENSFSLEEEVEFQVPS